MYKLKRFNNKSGRYLNPVFNPWRYIIKSDGLPAINTTIDNYYINIEIPREYEDVVISAWSNLHVNMFSYNMHTQNRKIGIVGKFINRNRLNYRLDTNLIIMRKVLVKIRRAKNYRPSQLSSGIEY